MKGKCRFGRSEFIGSKIAVGKRRATEIDKGGAQRRPAKTAERKRIHGHTSEFSALSFS